MKKFRSINLFWVLVIIPVILWVVQMPLAERFNSWANAMRSLGQVSALAGMALFAVTLILAVKTKLLDRMAGGLNVAYKDHHLWGSLSFFLLMMHPLFLAANYAFYSLSYAAVFLLPSLSDVPRLLGEIALFLMVALLAITFYMVFKYGTWKAMHRFLALAFVIAFFHLILIQSDVSSNVALRYYMIGLSVVAMVLQFCHIFLREYLIKKSKYEVVAVAKVGPYVEVSLKPLAERLKFQAGQFSFFKFFDAAVGTETHPFSFASGSGEENLKVVAKPLGDYTSLMPKISVGSKVDVDGPYGKFAAQNTGAKKQIWIAGGIGITPFLSMAKSLADSDYAASLYWSVRCEDEAVYGEIFQQIAASTNKLKYNQLCSDKGGKITAEMIEKNEGGLAGTEIFICGPLGMMVALRKQFRDKGLSNKSIHTEEFGFQ